MWDFPQTHFRTSSSIMAPFFANESCDPFLPKSAECVIGSYIQCAVNAGGASDYQNVSQLLAFKREKLIDMSKFDFYRCRFLRWMVRLVSVTVHFLYMLTSWLEDGIPGRENFL